MMTYTFESADIVTIGTLTGYHRWTVEASSWVEAWSAVRKLTSLPLVKVVQS